MRTPDAETGHEGTPRYRYETLADEIIQMIEAGILRVGMRAPSLRRTARRHRVSLTTALQAYRRLEDRGILQARPKSGFYVTGFAEAARAVPRPTSPPARPVRVAVGSDVWEVLEKAADPEIAPLGCAIPSAGLLAAQRLDRFLVRAARTSGVELNTYTEPRGAPDLRKEISRRALRLGQMVSPDDIVVTCGCTEALSLALSATTRPGDTVAIESPTYFGLLQALEARGLRALELPTDPGDGVDVGALATALQGRRIAACLFSSSFNNPLGCAAPDAAKLRIVDLLRRHEIPLIEDDIYGDIYFANDRPRTFAALAPDADISTCSSFSKTLAPGYRVGWVSSRHRLGAVLEAKFAATLCGPALPQRALADFLASGGYDNHLRRLRRALEDNIARMTPTIDRAFPPETRVTAPKGGFVLWLELPDGFDCGALYRRAIRERICFVPGNLFTATGRYRNCMRLSCGHAWDRRIERSVERLGELAREMMEAHAA